MTSQASFQSIKYIYDGTKQLRKYKDSTVFFSNSPNSFVAALKESSEGNV